MYENDKKKNGMIGKSVQNVGLVYNPSIVEMIIYIKIVLINYNVIV
jgi:hypothetical protein